MVGRQSVQLAALRGEEETLSLKPGWPPARKSSYPIQRAYSMHAVSAVIEPLMKFLLRRFTWVCQRVRGTVGCIASPKQDKRIAHASI